MLFGERLQQIRMQRGLKQTEVQKLRRLKDQSNISLDETNPNDPTLNKVLRWAKAYQLPPSELFQGVITDYDRIRAGEYDAPKYWARKPKQTRAQAGTKVDKKLTGAASRHDPPPALSKRVRAKLAGDKDPALAPIRRALRQHAGTHPTSDRPVTGAHTETPKGRRKTPQAS